MVEPVSLYGCECGRPAIPQGVTYETGEIALVARMCVECKAKTNGFIQQAKIVRAAMMEAGISLPVQLATINIMLELMMDEMWDDS